MTAPLKMTPLFTLITVIIWQFWCCAARNPHIYSLTEIQRTYI